MKRLFRADEQTRRLFRADECSEKERSFDKKKRKVNLKRHFDKKFWTKKSEYFCLEKKTEYFL